MKQNNRRQFTYALKHTYVIIAFTPTSDGMTPYDCYPVVNQIVLFDFSEILLSKVSNTHTMVTSQRMGSCKCQSIVRETERERESEGERERERERESEAERERQRERERGE